MPIDKFNLEEIGQYSFFKFNINWKKSLIKVEKNKILSIITNDSNILEHSINISELKDYLDKLK